MLAPRLAIPPCDSCSAHTCAAGRRHTHHNTDASAEARRDAAVELEAEYSGVNLDDEAARLLEQQQAYQALARVLRTASDLLDTLLNAIS